MYGLQQLVVVNPANLGLILTVGAISAVTLYIKARAKPFLPIPFALWSSLVLVVFAFVLESVRLTFDARSQTVTIAKFAFYHWSQQIIPLSNVDHAYLHTGAVSSRIVLQFSDGQTMSLTSNDQMSGKPEAVLAINQFLGRQ